MSETTTGDLLLDFKLLQMRLDDVAETLAKKNSRYPATKDKNRNHSKRMPASRRDMRDVLRVKYGPFQPFPHSTINRFSRRKTQES